MVANLKNINFTTLAIAALVIAVLTSREILVYNEELLVAISFFVFVGFAYVNLSDVFAASLDDRAKQIQKEFDYYFALNEEVLELLISYHGKRKSLAKELKNISTFSQQEIRNILNKYQHALENNISLQLEQKLKTIYMKEQSINQFIQEETSQLFSKNV